MGEGAEKNKICWCGSGKKYKKCHSRREENSPPTNQQVISGFKGHFNKKYCLHPKASKSNCSGTIVKAHTIQKRGSLNKIAHNQHVYQFNVNLSSPEPLLKPKLIGLNNASTFTGFCQAHDGKTFEPIEKHSFGFNDQHAFLLGYRAVCRELFWKRIQVEFVPFQRSLDSGKDLSFQILYQMDLNKQVAGAKAGLRDAEHHKKLYDSILLSSDYSNVNFYAIEFSDIPDVMCSASKFVSHDFDGNVLQDLSKLDEILGEISFSIIATDTGGAAVFSWLGKNLPAESFIKSLDSMSDNEIPAALLRFTFEFFENAFFSPLWWDGLAEDIRIKIQQRVSFAVDIHKNRLDSCLKDDGLRPVSWKIASRNMNIIS